MNAQNESDPAPIHPSDLATCSCGRTIYWCRCRS